MPHATSVGTCAYCAEQFAYATKRKNRKYCSRSCRSRATMTPEHMERLRSFQRNPNWRLASKPRSCVKCQQEYYPTGNRQKICHTCTPNKGMRTRLRRYNLTQVELDVLVSKHDGLCWICKANVGDCVDHNHDTGVVRGWLCRTCNMALHYVERPGWWVTALEYLDQGGDGNAKGTTHDQQKAVGLPICDEEAVRTQVG